MKWPKPLLTIILLPLYFLSCDSKPYPHVLQSADSLANICPDSAIVLLEQFKDSISQEPRETQMYYQLLTIKAKDKAYITHTSDSLILEIVRYYESKKNEKHLPEAYYYAGRVYRDLGDAPQALDYFFKAIDASSDTPTDYKLMSRIYSQIGTLYLYQDVYDKAPEAFIASYKYNILAKDSVGMVYNLRDIGRVFSTQQQIDSAIHYYKRADNLANKIKKQHLSDMVNSELSGYYTKLGMYQEAYKTMQISIRQINCQNTPARCAVAARYYYNTGSLDSAIYYYSQLVLVDDCLYKQGGYLGLANIAHQKKQYQESLSYFDKYLIYADSVEKITQTEVIRKVQALYNYQYKERENALLQSQSNKREIWNIILISFLIFLILSSIAYRQYYKRERQNLIIQQEKFKKIQEEQYKLSLTYLENNKKRIKELELFLQEAEKTKDQLRQDLLNAQKELIEKTNEQISANQKVQEQSEITLKNSNIYKKFHSTTEENNKKIKNNDWQELTDAIDETYNQFTKRLLELYPMKTIEMQVCLLIKINLSPTKIAFITIHTKQAITSIRKRLYKKVMGKDGPPEQWDNFIHTF